MKRVSVLTMLLIAMLAADVNWVRVIGWSDSPQVPEKKVMTSDSTGIIIRTAVFGFTEQDTTVDNKEFKRIKIPEEPIDRDTLRAGKPQIPYIRLLIAVPDSAEFEITINESEYTAFDNYLLYPIPGIVIEDTNGYFYAKEVYTYDTSFYDTDTLYPGKFYDVISDGHWRDQRVLEVFLYPVQFNPQQKLMYFYTGLNLRIEYSGEVVENENGLGPFEQMGRDILLNYPGIDRQPGSHAPPSVHYYTDLLNTENIADYIIVTHDDFLINETASYWIHEFARWRVDHNEFDVGIVKVQDIYEQFGPSGNDSTQLRNFLIYAYENWTAPSMSDGHFAYCLFIGDWDYVPTRLIMEHSGDYDWLCAYEGYFRELSEPADKHDDIMLGRWPVKETSYENLLTIAQKTINYEKYPMLGDWRRGGLVITGDGEGTYTFELAAALSKSYFTDIGYDTTLLIYSQINNPENFCNSIQEYLNLGEIITVYYDHGGPEAWWAGYDTGYVDTLRNNGRLPVVLSCACLTAMFQWDKDSSTTHPGYPPDTCLGEHFIFNDQGGAIAFYGSTKITGMGIMGFGLLCVERLLGYQYWILGKAVLGVWCWYPFSAEYYPDDCCLLGDPALDLGDYTAYPDLPDLVVRPRGMDISLEEPYPYPAGGDVIPIRAKVLNIGAAPAYNVDVSYAVILDADTIYDSTVRISAIQARDTAVVTVYWNTALTHPEYYGEIGDCKFMVRADPDDVIEESWEHNNVSLITKKVALYPNEPGWPKKVAWFTQPAIGNLDGAGSVEIVCHGCDSVYVFDKDGNIFNGWPKYFKGVHGIVLGNLDENDLIEVVAVSAESIKVYDYQGNLVPGWPRQIPASNYVFTGLPGLGYIDGVELPEVIMIARPSDLCPPIYIKVFVYTCNGILQHEFTSAQALSGATGDYMEVKGCAIEDILSSGYDELVVSFGLEGSDYYTEIFDYSGSKLVLGYGNDKVISALVDLTNPPDGIVDVITGGIDGKIRAYDVENDQLLWAQQTQGQINSSPAVGDVHPFELGVEITFGNDAGRIHLRRGINGENIDPWAYVITPNITVRTSPAIGNINGDRNPDIMIGANNQYVYALNYDKTDIAPYPLPLFGTPSSPIIGDIDGDKKNETILSSSDGYLHVWENKATKVTPYLLEWPQFHHDYQRTGVYLWSE